MNRFSQLFVIAVVCLGAGCGDDSGGTNQPDAPLASCTDGIVNQDETDTDCGGSVCGKCADGDSCMTGTDCDSGGCSGSVCVPTFTVSGTVTGLAGSGLVLQDGAGTDLTITANGAFTFPTPVVSTDTYDVTVKTPPGSPVQTCQVRWGTGVVSGPVTDIEVQCLAAPDNIADAFTLDEGVEVRFSTVGSTLEPDELVCDAGGTVWFSFTAPAAGDYTAYAADSDQDTEVAWTDALTGPLGDCNDDAADSYDAVDALDTLAVGDHKYVQMGLNSEDVSGTGRVGVVRVVPAADNFADAGTLTLRTGAQTAVAGLRFGGTETTEATEPTACGSTTQFPASAWTTFVAPVTGTWMIESKSSQETNLAVYTGDVLDNLTLLNCATADHRAVLVDMTAGTTYRIRVAVDNAVTGHVVLRAVRTLPPLTTVQRVDADGSGTSVNVGSYSDMAIVGGDLAVAYYDMTAGELRFAQRTGTPWSDVLIDADGDGTSTDVGRGLSLTVLSNGEPAVSYYDNVNQELRFAERSGGTWSDVLIDADGGGVSTDVGSYSSLRQLSNGDLGVAYYDNAQSQLRFARRTGGVWSDMLVDADGGGTATWAGKYCSLLELPGGLAISYTDQAGDLRVARFDGTAWTDELVQDEPDYTPIFASNMVVDASGHPVIAATNAERGQSFVARYNGSAWVVEYPHAERFMAQLDYGCAAPRLFDDSNGPLTFAWTDCNYAGNIASMERDASGQWTSRDLVRQFLSVDDADFDGSPASWPTAQFGAVRLPSGELAVSVEDDAAQDLWCVQGE